MTTSFKFKVPAILALIIALNSGWPGSVFGGCYCMMESKNKAAAYNKTGFYQNLYTGGPAQIFLNWIHVGLLEFHTEQRAPDSFNRQDWSFLDISEIHYIMTSQSLQNSYPQTGCHLYTLPYIDEHRSIQNGSKSDNNYTITWDYKNTDRSYYSGSDTDFSRTCEGLWHEYYSDGSSSSGSTCAGSPATEWSARFTSDTTWPWEQIVQFQTVDAHIYRFQFSLDYSGTGGYSINKTSGINKGVNILYGPFSDAELRKQIIARLPAWPDTWAGGTGTAYYLLNDDHSCGTGSKMKYRVKVPNSERLAIYKLEWKQVTQVGTNVASTTINEDVRGTGDPINPAVGETHEVDMPDEGYIIYETAPEVVEVVYPGTGSGGSGPGTGGPRMGR